MREDVIRVVEQYLDAVVKNDRKALPLAANIVFEGPLNRIEGIPAFEKGLDDFLKILKGVEIVRLTADDSHCAASLKLDTVFGEIDFLELIHVEGGLIVDVKAYYDPRPVLEGKARAVAN